MTFEISNCFTFLTLNGVRSVLFWMAYLMRGFPCLMQFSLSQFVKYIIWPKFKKKYYYWLELSLLELRRVVVNIQASNIEVDNNTFEKSISFLKCRKPIIISVNLFVIPKMTLYLLNQLIGFRKSSHFEMSQIRLLSVSHPWSLIN